MPSFSKDVSWLSGENVFGAGEEMIMACVKRGMDYVETRAKKHQRIPKTKKCSRFWRPNLGKTQLYSAPTTAVTAGGTFDGRVSLSCRSRHPIESQPEIGGSGARHRCHCSYLRVSSPCNVSLEPTYDIKNQLYRHSRRPPWMGKLIGTF